MKKIAITGGVGSGKSAALKYLSNNYNCKVVRADDVAKKLMEPGGSCYEAIIKAFPNEDLLAQDAESRFVHKLDTLAQCDSDSAGTSQPPFDKNKLAHIIYSNSTNRLKVNSIVHPAVKEYILEDAENEQARGQYDFYFFEVALAIEEGYDKLFDEVWYVHSSVNVRTKRLEEKRGYSKKRIEEIMSAQLSEEEYKSHATHIINNDEDVQHLYDNISNILHCDI